MAVLITGGDAAESSKKAESKTADSGKEDDSKPDVSDKKESDKQQVCAQSQETGAKAANASCIYKRGSYKAKT